MGRFWSRLAHRLIKRLGSVHVTVASASATTPGTLAPLILNHLLEHIIDNYSIGRCACVFIVQLGGFNETTSALGSNLPRKTHWQLSMRPILRSQ